MLLKEHLGNKFDVLREALFADLKARLVALERFIESLACKSVSRNITPHRAHLVAATPGRCSIPKRSKIFWVEER